MGTNIYCSEQQRLKSFQNYRCIANDLKFDDNLKRKFALAGLYWTKQKEKIKCAFCHFQLISLSAGDTDPVGLHYRYNSACRLYTCQEKTRNKPIDERLVQKEFQRNPSFRLYQSFDKRIKTFNHLIRGGFDKKLAEKLCYAGFFSMRGREIIKCFCCRVEANIKEELWKIVNKHGEKNNYCPFYLELCTTPEVKRQDTDTSKKLKSLRVQTDTESDVSDPLKACIQETKNEQTRLIRNQSSSPSALLNGDHVDLVEHQQTLQNPPLSAIADRTGIIAFTAHPMEIIAQQNSVSADHLAADEILPIIVKNLSKLDIICLTGFEQTRFDMLYSAINVTSNSYDTYLNCKYQFALTLIKYHHDIDLNIIARDFKLRTEILLEIFLHWTKLIYAYLKKINFWQIRYISSNEYMAKIVFKEILSEHSPLDPEVSQKSFSNMKNDNKFKYLLAIDGKGVPIFCSDINADSTSDRDIIKASGILDLVYPGDIILCNISENINEMLQSRNNAPNISLPSKSVKNLKIRDSKNEALNKSLPTTSQYHTDEFVKSRKIKVANTNLSKRNKILSSTISMSLREFMNEIVFNANMLYSYNKNNSDSIRNAERK